MKYDQGDAEDLKEKFWKEMASSPFVMLQLDADEDSAAPMTAQLDKDANSAIWFFTRRDNRFAELGPATVTYCSKGHDLYARFDGTLTEETSQERKDEMWNNVVEAWFPEGKNGPNVLMMRMDLGEAAIWSGELGMMTTAKMLLGQDITDDVKGGYAKTKL